MNDQIRAAIIAVVQSLLPALVLLNVVSLDDTQIAAIMLFITNAVTLFALLVKSGQEAAPV